MSQVNAMCLIGIRNDANKLQRFCVQLFASNAENSVEVNDRIFIYNFNQTHRFVFFFQINPYSSIYTKKVFSFKTSTKQTVVFFISGFNGSIWNGRSVLGFGTTPLTGAFTRSN